MTVIKETFIDEVSLYTDGGCRGNPGPGAIGILICDAASTVLHEHAECIGHTTNNQAEYKALIKGLALCAHYTRGRVCCYSDSQIVIKQVTGAYRLKNEALRPLFDEVKRRAQHFQAVVFQHVRRENPLIVKADRILNDAFEGRALSRTHQ
ncbi:MAG: ribonuclease HI family protein [Nitrospirales bacterium]|nr:ribonuclease HI family protein [Nitrospirales bacterium]